MGESLFLYLTLSYREHIGECWWVKTKKKTNKVAKKRKEMFIYVALLKKNILWTDVHPNIISKVICLNCTSMLSLDCFLHCMFYYMYIARLSH